MKKIFFITLFSLLLFSNHSYANDYKTKNGYEVELNWKVKHRKTLIVWGGIEDGKSCKQLKLHIGMKHNEGWYKNLYKNFNRAHRNTSRSPFKIENEHYSKNLPKKGWYPDRIKVTCSGFYKKG